MYCNGSPLFLPRQHCHFPVFLHLVSLFTGLLRSHLKGNEVARKRRLPSLVLGLDLEALPLRPRNPTRAKAVNLSQERKQITVLNHGHIPNPEEVQNPTQGHRPKGAQGRR